MGDKEFFKIYLPALEKALENDSVNIGFLVKGPEYFVDKELSQSVESFIRDNDNNRHRKLFEMIDDYFDSISHYSNTVGNTQTHDFREKLAQILTIYKEEYL